MATSVTIRNVCNTTRMVTFWGEIRASLNRWDWLARGMSGNLSSGADRESKKKNL